MPIDPYFFKNQASRDGDFSCPHCGYNLRGLSVESKCPECGVHPKESEEEEGDWHEESSTALPPHADQGQTLTDTPDDLSDAPGIRGSTRRPTCSGCGYDLSRHPPTGRCPECGREYGEQPRRVEIFGEPLMTESVIRSAQWRVGIGLLLIASIAFAGFTLFSLYSGSVPLGGFGFVMVLITAIWAVGSCLAMPQSLDGGSPFWRPLRIGSCVSQLLWPVSMVLAWGIAGDVLPMGLSTIVGLLDFTAFLGFVVLLVQLERMTRDMALRTSAKRLGSALWLVLPSGLIMSFLPVPTVADTGFVSAGAFAVIAISILLLPIYAIAIILILSLIDLAGFGHWTMRHERFLLERPDRIAAKKAAMNKGTEWLPMADRDEVGQEPCSNCGYDLHGHAVGATCPECGVQSGDAMGPPPTRAAPRSVESEDEPGDIPLL